MRKIKRVTVNGLDLNDSSPTYINNKGLLIQRDSLSFSHCYKTWLTDIMHTMNLTQKIQSQSELRGFCRTLPFVEKIINVHHLLTLSYGNHNIQANRWYVSRYSLITLPWLHRWLQASLLCRRPPPPPGLNEIIVASLTLARTEILNKAAFENDLLISLFYILAARLFILFSIACVGYLHLIEPFLLQRY